MAIIKIKRGSGSDPTGLQAGELAFRTDTGELFCHDGASVQKIGSKNMLTTAGGTLTGFLTLHSDPSLAMHAATKSYVDNVAAGLDIKPSVIAATAEAITLSGLQTIDGVSCVAGDRVLVKNQSDKETNGIYVVASGAWSRATDFASGTATFGAAVFVELGSTNAGKGYVAVSPEGKSGAIDIGTDQIDWTQFNAATAYTAGNGISINGSEISVNKGNGLDFSDGALIVKNEDSTIAVGSAGIKVGTIQQANIANSAVGTNQIANTAVTAAKLGSDVAGTGLTGGDGSAIAANFGTSAGTICEGNDSRLHNQNTDVGTSQSTFYIGSGGPKIRATSGVFAFRNNSDGDWVEIQVKKVAFWGTTYGTTIQLGTQNESRTLALPDESGTILTDASTIDGGTWS